MAVQPAILLHTFHANRRQMGQHPRANRSFSLPGKHGSRLGPGLQQEKTIQHASIRQQQIRCPLSGGILFHSCHALNKTSLVALERQQHLPDVHGGVGINCVPDALGQFRIALNLIASEIFQVFLPRDATASSAVNGCRDFARMRR